MWLVRAGTVGRGLFVQWFNGLLADIRPKSCDVVPLGDKQLGQGVGVGISRWLWKKRKEEEERDEKEEGEEGEEEEEDEEEKEEE